MQVRLLPPSRKRRFEENSGPVRFRGFPSSLISCYIDVCVPDVITTLDTLYDHVSAPIKAQEKRVVGARPGHLLDLIMNVKLIKDMQIVRRARCGSRLGTVIR